MQKIIDATTFSIMTFSVTTVSIKILGETDSIGAIFTTLDFSS